MIYLDQKYLEMLKTILSHHLTGHEVRLFGSRARGDIKPFSDIDLVIMNEKSLPLAVTAQLALAFEESNLPYRVDFVQWVDLTDDFKQLIKAESVTVLPAFPA